MCSVATGCKQLLKGPVVSLPAVEGLSLIYFVFNALFGIKIFHKRGDVENLEQCRQQATVLKPPSVIVLFPTEKNLQVPQGLEQPKSLGRGTQGNQSAGRHGSDLTVARRVHPPGSTADHLHPAC